MKCVLGAALGNDVHVAGLVSFLGLARQAGYDVAFLGAAVAPDRLIAEVRARQPDLVAVSYRLTPETAATLFAELRQLRDRHQLGSVRFVFGGTPPVAEQAKASGVFERVFSGQEPVGEITAFLEDRPWAAETTRPASTLVERIAASYPRPLLRHHFGRPTVGETVRGAKEIAESGVLDVLSLGPDQNAQASFFRPETMERTHDGAGGVPLRRPEDLTALFDATRTGNYPLVRCYAGTRDLLKWAAMSVQTIHNAWGAIPLCWYSRLDGRSDRPLPEAIVENQATIAWYARQGIPVEVNEAHQWSLRNAHDCLAVAMAFLAAYNAKKLGVRHYVAQYMFNTPPGTFASMDLAKMLAKAALIEELHSDAFTTYRQVRAGLAHFSSDLDQAKGQLAASAVIALAMNPHILHVVGFCEADHLVTAQELIASCRIVQGVLRDVQPGLPDLAFDPAVRVRKAELLAEVRLLLDALRNLGQGCADPWTDPETITEAIKCGLLDAPHLAGNEYARGTLLTGIVQGKCLALTPDSLALMTEAERLQSWAGRVW